MESFHFGCESSNEILYTIQKNKYSSDENVSSVGWSSLYFIYNSAKPLICPNMQMSEQPDLANNFDCENDRHQSFWN